MATYDETGYLESLAELTALDLYRRYAEAGALLSESALGGVDRQNYRDAGALVSESVLYGSALLREQPSPVIIQPPAGPPVEVTPLQKPGFSDWTLGLQVLSPGPFDTGERPGADHILGARVECRLSDPGRATVELAGQWDQLMGARLSITLELAGDAGDFSGAVFTGWARVDDETDVDTHPLGTRLQLSDSLAWLAERRLAISTRFRGGTSSAAAVSRALSVGYSAVNALLVARARLQAIEQARSAAEQACVAAAETAGEEAVRRELDRMGPLAWGTHPSVPPGTVSALQQQMDTVYQDAYDLSYAAAKAASQTLGEQAEQALADAQAEVDAIEAQVAATQTYSAQAGGTIPPRPLPQTRQQAIEQVLELVQFPFGAEFPDDGGALRWDVEVTEETPLDVIRLIAESAGWQFHAQPDGGLRFVAAHAPAAELLLSASDYDIASLGFTWRRTPINRVQVRGTPGEKQASATVTWEGSRGLIGKYDEQLYENAFIGTTEECGRIAGLILESARRAGRARVLAPVSAAGAVHAPGERVLIIDPDETLREGVLESRRLAFSATGRADIDLELSIEL